MTESSIVREVVEASEVLERANIRDAKREALNLWAGVTDLSQLQMWFARNDQASGADVRRFREAVQRRATGEPLAYVLGVAGFRYLDIRVDPRVLIPRPETEGLVEHVLAWGHARPDLGRHHWGTAVDVGTGSGCIALSLAVECEFDRVIATDASPDALEVARENFERVEPPTPVEFRHGRTLEPVGEMAVDVVVSNPPYVTEAEYVELDHCVKDHEPKNALVSGSDGMKHTQCVIEGAVKSLTPGGLLAIEVDCSRAQRALGMALDAGWGDARIEDDLFGYPRFLLATRSSK
jgi:release factor glutamine methyltransferase